MRAVVAASALAVLLGCPKGDSVSATCTPGEATCPVGKRCTSSRDCAADAGILCNRGVCMSECGAGGSCGPSQVCGSVGGKSWCLLPCADRVCPTGAPCAMYWPERREVCAASELGKACASVTAEQTCSTCGSKYFTQQCPQGGFCPGRSTCSLVPGDAPCVCFIGNAVKCDGGACDPNDPNDCPSPDYHCDSTQLQAVTCVDEPRESSGRCRCSDGREFPAVCGETNSCEYRCSQGCSLTAQDCPDAWAPKCTYLQQQAVATDLSAMPRDRTGCVPLTGNKALGERCSLLVLGDGGTELGRDDCDKGLVCEAAGAPRGERRCRKLCTANSECGPSAICARTATTFPPSGFCVPSMCTLGGSECPAGQSCMWIRDVDRERPPACKFDGPGAEGASCQADTDCGADLGCSQVCRRSCSGSKPCDAGTCAPIPGNRPGAPSLCF